MAVLPILVPLDGSRASEIALPFALELAGAFSADLRLMHVLPPAPERYADLNRDTLRFYIGLLQERCGVPASSWLAPMTSESPAGAIVEAARHAGLLVVASHGRGGFRAATIGSVADRVVRESEVPVLFVPVGASANALAGRPVVAGLDGSAPAGHALSIARTVARALASPMHLVEAYSVSALLRGAAVGIDLVGIVRENSEEYLINAALPGETHAALHGAAHEVLLEEADRVDAAMIAVGMQGEGLATRLLRGSVTDRLMRTSRRPLLIVPRPA